ncbi:MAG: hypothetical protein VW270_13030 [Candidatus Poseidoniales archaeon]
MMQEYENFDQNKIYVFDDVIPETYQNKVLHPLMYGLIEHEFMPHVIRRESAGEICHNIMNGVPEKELCTGFLSSPDNSMRNALYFSYVRPIFDIAMARFGLTVHTFTRELILFQIPSNKNVDHTPPHVDDANASIVGLYYPCDADGETIIYKERYAGTILYNRHELTVADRITPKKGRVVIFDGRTYHSNSPPKEHYRWVINCNMTV